MTFSFQTKIPLLLLFVAVTTFCAADDGIQLVGPANQSSDTAAGENATGEDVTAEIRVEVSKFEREPNKEKSANLVLAKLYNTKQAIGNSYVLHVEGNARATIIDPGYNGQAIIRYLESENLTPDAILLTSGYFFRLADNTPLKDKWPSLKIGVGNDDAAMLADAEANQSASYGAVTSPEANFKFNGGETIVTSSSITWNVLNTPGFTPGSLCYETLTKDQRLVFTGDFIYRDGVGGSQLPAGDSKAFDLSLQTFLEYAPAETLLYPAFGPNTTVDDFYRKISANASQDGMEVVQTETPAVVPAPLITANDSTAYQATVTEVYPATTYVYRDIAVPYFPTWGLSVWMWRPVVVLPPLHHYHDYHYRPWVGPSYHHRFGHTVILPPPPNFPPPNSSRGSWNGPPRGSWDGQGRGKPERPGGSRPDFNARPEVRPAPTRPAPTRPTPSRPTPPVLSQPAAPGTASPRPAPARPAPVRPTPSRPTPPVLSQPAAPGAAPGTASPRPAPAQPTPSRPTPGITPNSTSPRLVPPKPAVRSTPNGTSGTSRSNPSFSAPFLPKTASPSSRSGVVPAAAVLPRSSLSATVTAPSVPRPDGGIRPDRRDGNGSRSRSDSGDRPRGNRG
ncbi:MAG: MBL fold metallo-hydrolase [Planctomycetaceae bacterium]|jgi:glyoxylase-like metal-dependent hydrolase (beta-lactamase superfamily II)|nr:MBL fold metallo-hydrolase [Planctomycetaceae bacterium]